MQYKNQVFSRYIFVDETTVRLDESPLYHHRKPSKHPRSLPKTTKFRRKINIWGGISFKGPTLFAVNSITLLILYIDKLFIIYS